MNSKSTTKN